MLSPDQLVDFFLLLLPFLAGDPDLRLLALACAAGKEALASAKTTAQGPLQCVDFFRALRPFLPRGPDDDWIVALTCSAGREALADTEITTRCRSIVPTPDRWALAITCGCRPDSLIREAALAGDLAMLGRLCHTFPASIPLGLAAWTVARGNPETVLETLAWLHAHGYAAISNGDLSWILGAMPRDAVFELFAPTSTLAIANPEGPSEWAMALYDVCNHDRSCLEYLQHFYDLGWPMWGVPRLSAIHGHVATLEWLARVGVLGQLDLDEVVRIRQAADYRGAGQDVDDWLDVYCAARETGQGGEWMDAWASGPMPRLFWPARAVHRPVPKLKGSFS